jgi:hypothetical protein
MACALALHSIAGLISLVCFILVIVRMFQHTQTLMGVACLVGVLLCGIGGVVAFVYGWMKAGEWRMKDTMLTWTACLVVIIVVSFFVPIPIEAFGFRH